MLSATHSLTSNSTNSVVIMEMPKAPSSSPSPTLLQLFTNETNHCPSRHLLSVAYNLPCSYLPATRRTPARILGSALVPDMAVYLLLANASISSMALIFPFLTIKTVPMLRVIDLLYARRRSHMSCQAKTSCPPLREVLANRASLAMDLLRDPTHAHIHPSCHQTVRAHIVLISVVAAPIHTPRSHNNNHVLVDLLPSVRTPYATTERLMAAPVHRLMVALVLILPLNGRNLRFLEIPRAWTNECRESGGLVQIKKIWSLAS